MPVLSHKIIEVDPIVSTASRFLTTQFLNKNTYKSCYEVIQNYPIFDIICANLFDNRVADTLSEMVNTTKRLSGTLATMTPMKNKIASIQ